MMDTTKPRLYCEDCGGVHYCKKRPGLERKRFQHIRWDCSGEVKYAAGVIMPALSEEEAADE